MKTFRRIAVAAIVTGASAHVWAGDIVQVEGGGGHTIALDACGGVWTWGVNAAGQLGDGLRLARTTPFRVLAGGVKAVSASGISLALRSDGTVLAWGPNGQGQLGLGFRSTDVIVPTLIPSLAGVDAIAAGPGHALALVDGQVYSWGANVEGQLGLGGDPDNLAHDKPLRVTFAFPPPPPDEPPTTIVAIASGRNNNSYALDSRGYVWAWGRNSIGQVGRLTNALPQTIPGRVLKSLDAEDYLTGVVAIAASNSTAVALRADGTIWSWGFNSNGQLGETSPPYNTPNSRPFAAPVKTAGGGVLSRVTSIAGGTFYLLASTKDGTAWGWGQNANGQLGDGTTADRSVATQVVAEGGGFLGDVAAISSGGTHSIARLDDGAILTWGTRGVGQLGDGTTAFLTMPYAVSFDGASSVAAGGATTAATSAAGTFAWGANGFQQLGIGAGDNANRLVPTLAAVLGGLSSFSLGGNHTAGILGGAGIAWGLGTNGQLGNGASDSSATAVTVSNLTGIIQISAAGQRSMALTSDGTVWGWGFNGNGQLGNGQTQATNVPVQAVLRPLLPTDPPVPLSGVAEISASGGFSVARKANGTVWTWGDNTFGQLGAGLPAATTSSPYPVQVVTASGPLDGITSVWAGGSHTLARRNDGTVWAWGFNGQGQIGNGSLTDSRIAVQVPGLSGVVAVSAGGFSLAVGGDGSVWTWGPNVQGQLGDGTTTNRGSPGRVLLDGVNWLGGVVEARAGGAHAVARTAGGALFTWGNNDSGQLGNGISANRVVPGPVVFPDRAPPTATTSATPDVLWPPNKRLVPVSVALDAGDSSTGAPSIELAAAVSSESVAGSIGSFSWVGNTLTIELRADRLDEGPGRVYTLTFIVTDAAGNETTVTQTVSVPHDKR